MLPIYTADLIELLDKSTEKPNAPRSHAELGSFRDNLDTWLHLAGRRSIVDELVDMLEAQQNGEVEDVPERETQPSNLLDQRVIGGDAGLRQRSHASSVELGGFSTVVGDDRSD